ncbi:unnamed protein product [Musa textilis]
MASVPCVICYLAFFVACLGICWQVHGGGTTHQEVTIRSLLPSDACLGVRADSRVYVPRIPTGCVDLFLPCQVIKESASNVQLQLRSGFFAVMVCSKQTEFFLLKVNSSVSLVPIAWHVDRDQEGR